MWCQTGSHTAHGLKPPILLSRGDTTNPSQHFFLLDSAVASEFSIQMQITGVVYG